MGEKKTKTNTAEQWKCYKEKKIVWILTIVQLLEGTRGAILLTIKSVNHKNDFETIILM